MLGQNEEVEVTNNCQTCSALLDRKEDFDLPEDNVLLIDVDVELINKPHANLGNLQKKEQRVQRTDFVNNLKKFISALRNTGGGIVLVHINGLADGDTCLDYFNELVDVRLNDMIEDGSLFVQSYQKDWLLDTESNSEENKPFKGFVVIHVTGSSIVTTFNFNSKQSLDNAIIDVQSNAVIRFLKRKNCFQNKSTSIRGIPQINERRNIQVKGFLPDTLPSGLLQNAATFNDYLWEKCGLGGYISAFSKLDAGGSFFLGINEDETQYPKETYKSKTFTGVGIQFRDLQFREDTETAILQSVQNNTVIVTYGGESQNTPRDTIQVAFHPVEADKFVLEVAVAAVDGLLCYDKEGPEAYEFENNELKRLTIKEWYEGLCIQDETDAQAESRDGKNLTHRPVGRVDIRSLYQRRPPCMQIERSLEDIEATVLHGGLETIKKFPTNFPAGEAYVNLKTRLNELPTMENVGLAYIAKSLPATANMDIKYRTPGDVILDICLIRQGSPAVVLSVLTDMPVDMKLAQRYTSAVSKELTRNVRRFTTVTFNSIYGLLHEKDLMSQESFESTLSRIEKERSRLCVPDSLSMNREKYKHVVRAFLSSVAVTTLVSNKSEETLWFLTHKQFCILTQNIDHTEVHVDTCPGSGGGVLSLTVAQRLQKLGPTLLISDDPKLVERARKQNIDSKTFNDILQSDLMADKEDIMNVVIHHIGGPCSSQTPQLPQLLSGVHRRWVFHRQKGMLADEDGQQRQSLLPEPATVSDHGKSSSFLDREIRMVLVGKSGVGKSETGNTIAGAGMVTKIFASFARAMSVTKKCKQHSFKRFGYDLQLVDVPGFSDTGRSQDDIKEEIMKCVAMSSPGIHAILFIVKIGRFTEEDINTLERFLRCFGEESKRFVIVVFTGKDDLEADNDTIEKHVADCPVTLKKFLFDVNHRCISVNNRGKEAEKKKFTRDLIVMIKSMVDGNAGKCYKNEMYERCESNLREAEKIEKLEEKRQKHLEEKLKQVSAAYEEQLQSQSLKLQEMERQLEKSRDTTDERKEMRERLKALQLANVEQKKKALGEEKTWMAEQKEAAAEENIRRDVQELKDLQRTMREEQESMREEMRHEEVRKQIREKVEEGNTEFLGTAFKLIKNAFTSFF